jgi:hypothetical protein
MLVPVARPCCLTPVNNILDPYHPAVCFSGVGHNPFGACRISEEVS